MTPPLRGAVRLFVIRRALYKRAVISYTGAAGAPLIRELREDATPIIGAAEVPRRRPPGHRGLFGRYGRLGDAGLTEAPRPHSREIPSNMRAATP